MSIEELNRIVKETGAIVMNETPEIKSEEIELSNAPIGSVIEFEDGEVATVVGRHHRSVGGELGGVLLAWRATPVSRGSKYHAGSYFNPNDGVYPSPSIQRWLDTAFSSRPAELTSNLLDYQWARWYSQSQEINAKVRVISRARASVSIITNKALFGTVSLNTVPLGTEVEWNGIQTTVVGRAENGDTLLGRNDAERPSGWVAIKTKLYGDVHIDSVDQYKWFHWASTLSNHQCRVIKEATKEIDQYSTDILDVPLGTVVEFQNHGETITGTVVGLFEQGKFDGQRITKPLQVALAFKTKPSSMGAHSVGKVVLNESSLSNDMAYGSSNYELAPNYKDFPFANWIGHRMVKVISRGNGAYIKPQKQVEVSKEQALELANLVVKVGTIQANEVDGYAQGVGSWTKEVYDDVYRSYKECLAAQFDTAISDVPLGSEVEYDNGFVATVIGRKPGSQAPYLGWKDRQSIGPTPYSWDRMYTTRKRVENKTSGYDFVPDALEYQYVSGWSYNPSAKVKVRTKPMTEKQAKTVALKDVAIGSIVKDLNGATSVVVGKDANGYICLGNERPVSGFIYGAAYDRVRFAAGSSLADATTKYPYTRWCFSTDLVEVVSAPGITHPSELEVSEVVKDSLYLGIIRPSEVAEETRRIRQGSKEDLLALKQVIKEAKEEEQKFFDQSLKQAQDLMGSMAPNVQVHRMNMEEFKKLVDKLHSGSKDGKDIVVSDELVNQMVDELQKIWEETTNQPTQQQRVAETSTKPMIPETKTYTLSQLNIGDEVQCQDQYGIPVCGTIVGEADGYYAVASNINSASRDARDTVVSAVRDLVEGLHPKTFASNTLRYKHFTWVPKTKTGCILLRASQVPFHSIADAKREEAKVQASQTSQKENTMSNTTQGTMSKTSFWDTMKSEGKEAGWRIASTQIMKAAKTGILAALRSKGTDGGKLAAIAEFLDTEIGNAIISGSLGHVLPHLPGNMGKDPRVVKLAKEFRVQGYTTAGNELVGTAMEHILPAITTALQALPKDGEETGTKTRVSHDETGSEENEESEEMTNGKKAAV